MFLTQSLWLYRLSHNGTADNVLIDLQDLVIIFRKGKRQGIVHILLGNSITPHGKLDQVIKYAFCLTNGLFRTDQLDLAVPGDHGHMKGPFYFL